MEKKYKEFLDSIINRFTENITSFKITSLALIKMMFESGDCEGELQFYSRIVEAIINEDKNISYEEKEQFVAMHEALIKVYKNQ